jgi:hypothetical protein
MHILETDLLSSAQQWQSEKPLSRKMLDRSCVIRCRVVANPTRTFQKIDARALSKVMDNRQNVGLQYGYDYFPSHQVRRRRSRLLKFPTLDQVVCKTN